MKYKIKYDYSMNNEDTLTKLPVELEIGKKKFLHKLGYDKKHKMVVIKYYTNPKKKKKNINENDFGKEIVGLYMTEKYVKNLICYLQDILKELKDN